ncbi:hypothetical protein OIE68_19365 [Nocardia vinacea]|uniref:Uncharacterized protein n=1 Tax=Nocardia vinacea TaxID=96468 RepID=A0ABZ1YZY0_9NOCA|nr:hypothetical protein [Nocardia vinacea]WSF98027.1 hypothetical protein OIE68_19365 [Nocardia vinacea]
MNTPIRFSVVDVLHYFGKCPRCGYSATAAAMIQTFADGATESQLVATCGQPCGWSGPVALTTMTDARSS